MANVIQQSLETIRSLVNGVDPRTGEQYPANSPYFNHQTIQALQTAIKSLEGRPKRIKNETKPATQLVCTGKPWRKAEELRLTHAFDYGVPLAEIARQHDRTELGIRSRLVKLGKLVSRY